jgi:hypothetical protein
MLQCSYKPGRAGMPNDNDEGIACGSPVLSARVCNECGCAFCSEHIGNCDFCGELFCAHCAFHHGKACSYNEAEAS